MPSTNDRAKILAEQGAPDRSLVITRNQTAGKGRGGNRWWSGSGVLTFSILIRPVRPVRGHSVSLLVSSGHPALLSLVTGLAVVRGIRLAGQIHPLGVKWPNDLYSNSSKIGGILVESVSRRGRMDYVVVGIGINVNTTFRSAPNAIRLTASSLRLVSGRIWNESRLLASILRQFFGSADLFFRRGFVPFVKTWRDEDIIGIGRSVSVTTGPRQLTGTYQGLQENGAIGILTGDGRTHSVISGTLEL